MDTITATTIIITIFALVIVAAFLRFRQHGKAEIKGPFNTGMKLEASNDPPAQTVGIRAKNITSTKGGVMAEDSTGHGISAEDVLARDDVLLSSSNPEAQDNPKTQPPT